MKRVLYYGAAAAALATIAAVTIGATPAMSQGYSVNTRCSSSAFAGGRTCRTEVQPIIAPAPMTAEEIAEREARIAKWEEYCKPVLGKPNSDGMRTYGYAHAGCDAGRSE